MAAHSTRVATQGEGTAPPAPPAPPALRNIMDMPEALITVLLEHMFRSDLAHNDRAALGCVNKCLHRLCRALGSFHSLQLSTDNLFASLQHIASNINIDGLKIEGATVDGRRARPDDPVDGQQPLCNALGAIAIAPAAVRMRALYIDTGSGLLAGSALGSLWSLSSLQALQIHSLHPSDDLSKALNYLTGLTSLDVAFAAPTTPTWGAGAANRYMANDWGTNSACRFPKSLVKCTSLRQLSLHCEAQGLVYFDDVPAALGNLTALETASLVRCKTMLLPATITRLSRLTSLTVEDDCWDEMEVPEGFRSAMPNLQHISPMLSKAVAHQMRLSRYRGRK